MWRAMSEIYSGLCLGGPLDGKIVSNAGGVLVVPLEGEIAPTRVRSDGTPATAMPRKVYQYLYMQMDKDHTYWIDYDEGSYKTAPKTVVLRELTKAYKELHNAKNRV